jgi:predicted nucleic acid-binding protein
LNRVYWDTMIFIYLLEGHPDLAPLVKSLHDAMQNRNSRLFTSAFTIGEVLAGLEKLRATELSAVAQEFFSSRQVEILPFDLATAKIYASVRAQTNARAQDAIHIATAAHTGVDLFITNDKKLQKLCVPGIRFIAGLDGRLW